MPASRSVKTARLHTSVPAADGENCLQLPVKIERPCKFLRGAPLFLFFFDLFQTVFTAGNIQDGERNINDKSYCVPLESISSTFKSVMPKPVL